MRVHDRERDHWSRTSPLGLLYILTVELLRELTGPSRVVGNHVIIDIGDGVYAVLAYLRRRSVRVAAGQRPRETSSPNAATQAIPPNHTCIFSLWTARPLPSRRACPSALPRLTALR